ncbi:MAG: MoaD/ThiS family protein [Planctomycetota bacterium]
MNIRIQIPSPLRRECEGQAELVADVETVRQALDWIKSHYPKLYRSVCYETDEIRQHVNLFVNDLFLYQCDGVTTRFQHGDTLTIMPSVSGG